MERFFSLPHVGQILHSSPPKRCLDRQFTEATQCPGGAENPSRSLRSCWHVLRVPPELTVLCADPRSSSPRKGVWDEALRRAWRADGEMDALIGDRGRLNTPACLRILLSGSLKTAAGDSQEALGLGWSHSSNLLPKRTHGARVQPQPVLGPMAASQGRGGIPHALQTPPSGCPANKCWCLLLDSVGIFCSLWGEMEG